jgi:hypothetical protein
MAIADLNGDGFPDIVSSTSISPFPSNPARTFVFLGSGGGAFGSPTVLDPGGECWSAGQLKLADVNQDGFLDIILAEGGSNSLCFGNKVSVQLGNGAGGFATPGIITSTGGSLLSFGVGDFNEDGKLDLALRVADVQSIYILLGVGDGTFTQGAILSGGYPENIVVKDLNGDGHLDLAATYDTGVKIFFGNGNGPFSTPVLYPLTNPARFGIAVGDFNEDGIYDLAVSNGTQGSVFVLLGTGGGGFSAPVNFPAGTNPQSEVVAADFDKDGHEDIAVGNCGAGTVTILLGNGKGSFAAPVSFPAGQGDSCRLASADLNGDGFPDLVASSQAGMVVLLNNSAQIVNQPPVAACQNVTVSAGPTCTATASIDNGSFDPDPGDSITLSQSPSGPYPLGNTTVTLTVTDSHGAMSSCTAVVTVIDETPPSVSNVSVTPSILWPPNHRTADVTVTYDATDNCGPVACTLSVTSNEPIDGLGDGDTAPDWQVVDAHHVRLRAERSGTGNGRVYTITITCTDDSGNTTVRTVTVSVPHNQGTG